jgi:hypothetical protein
MAEAGFDPMADAVGTARGRGAMMAETIALAVR